MVLKLMDSNIELKKSKNLCIDRISDLPDLVLGKILSYLPIEYAVCTSILSTRWKNIFLFLVPPIKLDLDDPVLLRSRGNKYESRSRSRSFVSFVDRLLNETLRGVPCVDQLTFRFEEHYGDAKFMSWVCGAVRLNVRVLRLKYFRNSWTSLSYRTTLFNCLNGCTTLTRLDLTGKFIIEIPDNFSLPSLRTLRFLNTILSWIDTDDEGGTIMAFINGCPALEELCLTRCVFPSVSSRSIKSPLLKTLLIQNSLPMSCRLLIDTPNLETLVLKDCVGRHYISSRFSSLNFVRIYYELTEQQLDIFYEAESSYYEVVRDFVLDCHDTLRHLYLATYSMEYMHKANTQLPAFQNLTCLSLDRMNGSHGCMFFARLLCSAPCLKKLVLEKGFKDYEDGYSNFESALSTPPPCLESHLMEIKIRVFDEKEDEIKLVEYFLNHGKVLQTLKLHCLPVDIRIYRRLMMLPKILSLV